MVQEKSKAAQKDLIELKRATEALNRTIERYEQALKDEQKLIFLKKKLKK